MKNLKRYLSVITVAVMIGTASIAFAGPSEVVSELTGKTATAVSVERQSGKTYGVIAKDANKLDEFKSKMLEEKKTILDERVAEGNLTQEKADEIYNEIKGNQITCDGTGTAKIGQKHNMRFGNGQGLGQKQGKGLRDGSGNGRGNSQGQGRGMHR